MGTTWERAGSLLRTSGIWPRPQGPSGEPCCKQMAPAPSGSCATLPTRSAQPHWAGIHLRWAVPSCPSPWEGTGPSVRPLAVLRGYTRTRDSLQCAFNDQRTGF